MAPADGTAAFDLRRAARAEGEVPAGHGGVLRRGVEADHATAVARLGRLASQGDQLRLQQHLRFAGAVLELGLDRSAGCAAAVKPACHFRVPRFRKAWNQQRQISTSRTFPGWGRRSSSTYPGSPRTLPDELRGGCGFAGSCGTCGAAPDAASLAEVRRHCTSRGARETSGDWLAAVRSGAVARSLLPEASASMGGPG